MRFFGLILVFATVALMLVSPVAAQDDVTIEHFALTDNIGMLTGQGGNLGVCYGPDGVFLIDDQFAPLSDKILASIGELSDQPLRFLINTHWHGDHTGGNENMAGAGAVIVAHNNVRERLSTEQISKIWDRNTPASPHAALPVVTFESALSFHLNGQTIEVFHVPNAHTDGDAIVHFVEADIYHTGDIFFNGLYPFVDSDSGGSLSGLLAAVNLLLLKSTDTTRFIPGHGKLASRADLSAYRDMLVDFQRRIAAGHEAGLDLAGFMATNPTADYEETWGKAWLDGEAFMRIVYEFGEHQHADHH